MTDFKALLEALVDANVEFVLVGGLAAIAHGSARLTQDVDVVYARDPKNLERLADALAGHRPYLRVHHPDYRPSSVWTRCSIYHFEEHERFGPAATELLQATEEGRYRLVVSILGRLETLVAPKRHGRDDLCRRYREMFEGFPNLEVVDVDAQVVETASDLRATHGLRTPDAIHLATALDRRTDALVTEDGRHFPDEVEGFPCSPSTTPSPDSASLRLKPPATPTNREIRGEVRLRLQPSSQSWWGTVARSRRASSCSRTSLCRTQLPPPAASTALPTRTASAKPTTSSTYRPSCAPAVTVGNVRGINGLSLARHVDLCVRPGQAEP